MSTFGERTGEESERAVKFAADQWAIWVVRMVLGVIFILHGGQKIFGWFGGHPLEASVGFFVSKMHIPVFLAYVSIFTEFVGGILLVLGIISRIVGIGLLIDMIVAVALVHFKNGFFISGGPGPGYEYNVALMAMSLAIAIAGPGAFAAADWEGRLLRRQSGRP